MNGHFINSDLIQLDRKEIALADIKHIINQRTQRAVYTMGTQSAVGAFMSQNNQGSVLVIADGTGNQPGDVCTIISRTPDVAPERWAQHQYEAVVQSPAQWVGNGTPSEAFPIGWIRTTMYELQAPLTEGAEGQAVGLDDSVAVVSIDLPDSAVGAESIIISLDYSRTQNLLMLANDGAGWYINYGFIPNTYGASIVNNIFFPGTLGTAGTARYYTYFCGTPANRYNMRVKTVQENLSVIQSPVGTTAGWVDSPIPSREIGLTLNRNLGELDDTYDLEVQVGDYRYVMEKVGGIGNNFVVYSSSHWTGVEWLADETPKLEVTVTPDNKLRFLPVTSPEGYFGFAYNRLAQYIDDPMLTGAPVSLMNVTITVRDVSAQPNLIQQAWVDFYINVPEVIGFQEVPTWNLPFVDGVPQFDRSGGEFYAEFNDISQVYAAQATGLGQKAVLWTPPAQQLLLEHARDLLIEIKNELSAARGNELSNILGVLNNILAKP